MPLRRPVVLFDLIVGQQKTHSDDIVFIKRRRGRLSPTDDSAFDRAQQAKSRAQFPTEVPMPSWQRGKSQVHQLRELKNRQKMEASHAAKRDAKIEALRLEVETLRAADEASKRKLATEIWKLREEHEQALVKTQAELAAERERLKALRAELAAAKA